MRKTNFKKLFTLIELIVTIVVIGILAAIVIPNISSFKEDAKETAMLSDGKNLQTAIDMYQLDNDGNFPTIHREGDSTKLELGNPKSLDFKSLYPVYIRDLPQHKGMYYWVDYQGKLYYSMLDNPNDFSKEDTELTWTANEKASAYRIYEVQSQSASSSGKFIVKSIAEVEGTVSSFSPKDYSKGKNYLLSVVDIYQNEAAPVKSGYMGGIPFLPDSIDKIPIQDDQGTNPDKEIIVTSTNPKIALGHEHTLIVDDNGTLWSIGSNEYGQLGYLKNSGYEIPNPEFKEVMKNITSVFAGRFHSLALEENGNLWSFGYNYSGELGHQINNGNSKPNYEAKHVLSGIKSVAAGSDYTMVIDEEGTLWSFGSTSYGKLGYSTSEYRNHLPVEVMKNVKSVSAGSNHTLVVKENGELWGFGNNVKGELTLDLNLGRYQTIPKYIMSDVDSASAGGSHSLVVKQNGELWTFGSNLYGQLGHNAPNSQRNSNPNPKKILENVKSAIAGSNHSLVITQNGELLSFGYNRNGELGRIPDADNPNYKPTVIMSDVKSAEADLSHSFVLKKNGELWSFGLNTYGTLGYSTNTPNYNPIPQKVPFNK